MGRTAIRLVAAIAGALFVIGVVGSIQSRVSEKKHSPLGHVIWLGHSDLFGDLARPSVPFDHDGHTKALTDTDCEKCHTLEKKVETGQVRVYQFPREEATNKADSLMEAYHQACMNCHNERRDAGQEAGPTACGECHLESPPKTTTWESMGYDYATHHKHTQAMEAKCELCHHIYDEEQKKLVYKKNNESSCRDCHGVQDEEKKRSFRNVAHAQCLDCHMKRANEALTPGPFTCAGCHGERERMTIKEMARLPRLFREQGDKVLLHIDDGRMKAVPFDHLAHEGRVRFCRDCHHRTHQVCSSCHTLAGSPEGSGITLEAAFHDPVSRLSCTGCHEVQKKSTGCMGCHLYEDKGAMKRSCVICHSGSWELPSNGALEQLMETLPEEKVPEKVEIKILEKQYEPAVMPHRRIVKRLLSGSKENQLADRFHAGRPATCLGCHHEGPWDLEAKPPGCHSCHGVLRNTQILGRPGLMGAYHRQCMGCHERMAVKALGCADCHKEKPGVPLQVQSEGDHLADLRREVAP